MQMAFTAVTVAIQTTLHKALPMTTVYDFEALTINGQSVPLDQYKGKPLLIVIF